jgi:acetolactate synthase-1/2/3 large subunit
VTAEHVPNAPAQPAGQVTGHGGAAIAAAAQAHGADTLWTLSGAHIFPLYDAAVGGREGIADPSSPAPLRLVDTRHEATAVFAAEATAKLTRRPGFAAVTAGPGVTNAVSPITSAWFNGSPMVVVGGRAPDSRWGSGALQELDQPPLLAPVTKRAWTCHDPAAVAADADAAFALAGSAHRGPVFLDVPMDVLFTPATFDVPAPAAATDRPLDHDTVRSVAARIAAASRPVVVLGSDVWMDGAAEQALRFVTETGLPVVANGMGRGLLPPGHRCLVTRARGAAFAGADLVVVVGTPLDFRLGFGRFGGQEGAAADVVHIVDAQPQLATHVPLAGALAGDLPTIVDALTDAVLADPGRRDVSGWREGLAGRARAAAAADEDLLTSAADPVHPARIYGELRHRLESDAVVIGDGGDFVSFAGRFIEPARPGGWLDPGPYGCLGTGLGYAMAARVARPSSQVVLLLGDGAAGFSLMDVDTLVRHGLPVVMVVGNNATWGLEKHPMRFLYGYDVAADLRPTRYDEVVRALGGAGETVERPDAIGPALDRAFASGVPYLVNVLTDTAVAYPRSTTGV